MAGRLCWLGERPVPREVAQILAPPDIAFRAIAIDAPNDSPIELAASVGGGDAGPRGIKRQSPMVLLAGWRLLQPTSGAGCAESNLRPYGTPSSHVARRKAYRRSASRMGEKEAVNRHATRRKLAAKLATAEITNR